MARENLINLVPKVLNYVSKIRVGREVMES